MAFLSTLSEVYRQASDEFALRAASYIENNWNAALGKVTINDVEDTVNFKITAEYKPNLTK